LFKDETGLYSLEPDRSSDYTPCTYANNADITCDQVPLEEIQKVFKRTSTVSFEKIQLNLRPNLDSFIPADLFVNKRTIFLKIWNPDYSHNNDNNSVSLKVDPNAFRSTKSYTRNIAFHINDCSQIDFGFLDGFNQLTDLSLYDMDNIQTCFQTIPPLPNLSYLHLQFVGTGQNEFFKFPNFTNGLRYFKFGNYETPSRHYLDMFDDGNLGRILDWLLISSANTLKYMLIENQGDNVTLFPTKIPSFKALEKLDINRIVTISTIKTGQLSFFVPVFELYLYGNGINEIEPGAFEGI